MAEAQGPVTGSGEERGEMGRWCGGAGQAQGRRSKSAADSLGGWAVPACPPGPRAGVQQLLGPRPAEPPRADPPLPSEFPPPCLLPPRSSSPVACSCVPAALTCSLRTVASLHCCRFWEAPPDLPRRRWRPPLCAPPTLAQAQHLAGTPRVLSGHGPRSSPAAGSGLQAGSPSSCKGTCPHSGGLTPSPPWASPGWPGLPKAPGSSASAASRGGCP